MSGRHRRRRTRTKAVACLALGTALLSAAAAGLVTSAAHAAGEPGSGFQALTLIAESAGARIVFTQKETKQPTGAAEADVPFAQVVQHATSGQALSSIAWPGTLAGNLGKLYTLSTDQDPPVPMNDPVRAEAETGAGEPSTTMGVPGGTMSAKATAATVVADAQIGGTQNAAVGSFGTTHALSQTKLTGASTAE